MGLESLGCLYCECQSAGDAGLAISAFSSKCGRILQRQTRDRHESRLSARQLSDLDGERTDRSEAGELRAVQLCGACLVYAAESINGIARPVGDDAQADRTERSSARMTFRRKYRCDKKRVCGCGVARRQRMRGGRDDPVRMQSAPMRCGAGIGLRKMN